MRRRPFIFQFILQIICLVQMVCLVRPTAASETKNVLPGSDLRNYFHVADAWSHETQQKYYGEDLPYNAQAFYAVNSVLYETPVSLFGMPIEEVTNPVSNSEIQSIADTCRTLADRWQRVACAATSIRIRLENEDYGLLTAPCRAMSTTFLKVFRKLNLSNAWVGYKAANFTMPLGKSRFPFPTFHVANVIVMRGLDQRIYSYVLDLAYHPNFLFPVSEAAVNYHTNQATSSQAGLPKIF